MYNRSLQTLIKIILKNVNFRCIRFYQYLLNILPLYFHKHFCIFKIQDLVLKIFKVKVKKKYQITDNNRTCFTIIIQFKKLHDINIQ